jgi:Ecdysteroid kinase-like family
MGSADARDSSQDGSGMLKNLLGTRGAGACAWAGPVRARGRHVMIPEVEGEVPVVREIEELTPAWLERVVGAGPVEAVRAEAIGTGQMSQSHRVHLAYAPGAAGGPASVVVKTAAADPTSRSTGVGLGIYEREIRFYRNLAPRLGGAVAPCHAAVLDEGEGWFTLVLEDAAPAVQGDQIAGCGVEDARLAIHALAAIHAPVFADPELGAAPWLNQQTPLNQALMTQLLPAFVERYGARLADEHRRVCERLVASLDGWSAERRPPLGLVHGDFRLDNMLFGGPGSSRPFTIVDWQTVGWGPAMIDASYFLGASLSVEDRRAHERALLEEYHDELSSRGVSDLSWEECWEGYRRQCFVGVLMTVAPALLVERTERGDEMFITSLTRYAQQALDLGALELLPPPGSSRAAPLRPAPEDEDPHPPGAEELWNESWYFDAIDERADVGVWVRLGLYPNLGVCWATAFICGPGRPTAAVIDFHAPLPAHGSLTVESAGLELSLDCAEALERFVVRMTARGELHEDAADLLRGESGEPVPCELELEWQTDGEPYAYRMTTRYEIPCRVSGRARVGEEELALSGPGQRDHSWGVRDWWAAEWMWCAGRLDDGTRFHGVEFRLPDAPRLGVGYVQPPGAELKELDDVRASEEVGPDGLITAAQIALSTPGPSLAVAPLAFGPLRLLAPDGRVSLFPRAMCRVASGDGRGGLAWVEWNRNVSA